MVDGFGFDSPSPVLCPCGTTRNLVGTSLVLFSGAGQAEREEMLSLRRLPHALYGSGAEKVGIRFDGATFSTGGDVWEMMTGGKCGSKRTRRPKCPHVFFHPKSQGGYHLYL